MELQEELNAIKAEVEMLRNALQQCDAEKTAIDQMLLSSLKDCLAAKKDLLLANQKIQQLLNPVVPTPIHANHSMTPIDSIQSLLWRVTF